MRFVSTFIDFAQREGAGVSEEIYYSSNYEALNIAVHSLEGAKESCLSKGLLVPNEYTIHLDGLKALKSKIKPRIRNNFLAELNQIKEDQRTELVITGQDEVSAGFNKHYYFIDGREVSKEAFILDSGKEHLLHDQSCVKCTKCGNQASPDHYKSQCGERIFNDVCQGIFF